MKYKELYKVLDQRKTHSTDFSYSDYSGWKDRPQSYLSLSRPLWIIAEDHHLGYRFWITQSTQDMRISYAKMTATGGNEKNLTYHQPCRSKNELAEQVSRLFAELDAAAA